MISIEAWKESAVRNDLRPNVLGAHVLAGMCDLPSLGQSRSALSALFIVPTLSPSNILPTIVPMIGRLLQYIYTCRLKFLFHAVANVSVCCNSFRCNVQCGEKGINTD